MFASINTAALTIDRVQSHGTSVSLIARLRLGLIARAQRKHLLVLPPHMLADIGLTEHQAATEAARPLWDVPKNWLA